MLVIIDIQSYYVEEFNKQALAFLKMMDKIEERAAEAIKRKEKIINLITPEDGPTLPAISKIIKKAGDNGHLLLKFKEDGSRELDHFINKLSTPPFCIELSGIFRDVCVLETWKGLKSLGYNVLPVSNSLTISTSSNWRKIERYPAGYEVQDARV